MAAMTVVTTTVRTPCGTVAEVLEAFRKALDDGHSWLMLWAGPTDLLAVLEEQSKVKRTRGAVLYSTYWKLETTAADRAFFKSELYGG